MRTTLNKDKEIISRFVNAKLRFVNACCEMDKDIDWLEKVLKDRKKKK